MPVAPPFADRRRPVPGGRPPREVAEAIFPTATVTHVDGWTAIADAFDRLDDQRPATCGAYATRYLLSPLGFRTSDGVSRQSGIGFLRCRLAEIRTSLNRKTDFSRLRLS